jgi:hypothetical protein
MQPTGKADPRSGLSGLEMTASPEFIDHLVRQWVESSCRAQGLQVKVADAAVVKRVGVLLTSGAHTQGRTEAERAQAVRREHVPSRPSVRRADAG